MSEEQKFHIIYKLELRHEGLAKEAVPEGFSACDACVVLPISFPTETSFSMMVRAVDGRNAALLSSDDIWKAWVMLAYFLQQQTDLAEAKGNLARAVYDAVLEGNRSSKHVAQDGAQDGTQDIGQYDGDNGTGGTEAS